MFRRTLLRLAPSFRYCLKFVLPAVVLLGHAKVSIADNENVITAKYTPLTRNFVADAVAQASPSVVNIRCNGGGVFGGEASGSGFILTRVNI